MGSILGPLMFGNLALISPRSSSLNSLGPWGPKVVYTWTLKGLPYTCALKGLLYAYICIHIYIHTHTWALEELQELPDT